MDAGVFVASKLGYCASQMDRAFDLFDVGALDIEVVHALKPVLKRIVIFRYSQLLSAQWSFEH